MHPSAPESPLSYLEFLSRSARKRHDAWWLRSERTGTDESRRDKLLATLRFFGEEQRVEDLDARLRAEPESTELSEDLRAIVEQTASDLEDYLRPEDVADYRRTGFGVLPLSSVDAFCVNRTLWGTSLDGYLVVMNEGLFICVQLLAKAFLLDNLNGDLEQYRKNAVRTRHTAIQHFIAPHARHCNEVMFDHVPAEVEGILSAAQMSMTILMIQFVLLHELGHIAHHDFQLMSEYQFHVGGGAQTAPAASSRHWAAEFAADEYALAAICRRTRSDLSRWANFVIVYGFFDWLQAVERTTGRSLCPLHPPPQARGRRLMRYMLRHVPLDSQCRLHVRQSLAVLKSWR